jgi:DNA-binding transcriptional regulator LsrR (DeoR family)
MPGVPRQTLTRAQERRLEALERRIERARAELEAAEAAWAAYVREVGQAAVARRLGITDQALSERIRRIERRR